MCEGEGILYSEAEPEYCEFCPEGRKLNFFNWFREAKKDLVAKVSVV